MSSRDKVRTLRGRVAVVGIGETTYYKHGQSPDAEFKLALKAILAACADAGLDPRQIDGFASYSDDRSEAMATRAMPFEVVRDFFFAQQNHFDAVDCAA